MIKNTDSSVIVMHKDFYFDILDVEIDSDRFEKQKKHVLKFNPWMREKYKVRRVAKELEFKKNKTKVHRLLKEKLGKIVYADAGGLSDGFRIHSKELFVEATVIGRSFTDNLSVRLKFSIKPDELDNNRNRTFNRDFSVLDILEEHDPTWVEIIKLGYSTHYSTESRNSRLTFNRIPQTGFVPRAFYK